MVERSGKDLRSGRGFRRNALVALVFLSCQLSSAAAGPIAFAPQYAGSFPAGGGASARFVQIDGTWQGSTVLWNESTHTYGSGQPIGSFAWGTGLWGRNDWQSALAAATGGTSPGLPPVVAQWTGVAPLINFGNDVYNLYHSSTWGPAQPVPLFTSSSATQPQENWIAHFAGFIRVTEPGTYNFGVLNDDGFFFRLIGAGGAALEIGRDFLNPRYRNGFGDDLVLAEGLYGFELGMWNRLEAGVVDLRWSTDRGKTWTLVPTTSLLTVGAVPLPSPLSLLLVSTLAAWLPLRRLSRPA
jgi:hypothetical protein